MAIDKKIQSGTEFVTDRGQTVWNTKGGTIVADENTGQEKFHISHPSGANLNFNNQTVSLFAPNNQQELTNGDKFSTTAGDNFETTKGGKEIKVEEDLTIITGSKKFFTDTIAADWIEANRDIAAAKTAPEYTYGAIGNNTEATFEANGTPDADSGAVEGGSYDPNPAHEDIPALMEAKAGEIADIERQMGPGGNVKMMSSKHIYFQAGPKPVTYDSSIIVPNGKSVTSKFVPDGSSLREVKTSTSVVESKDTSGAVPFGDVHISAGTKINMNSGSGGVSIKSAGEVNMNSTGRLMLGGAEVAIGGSTTDGSGRVTIITDKDVFIKSKELIALTAPNINMTADDQITYITAEALFTGNLHVQGDLHVQGTITAGGDIIAGNGSVSLLNHTHGGVETGGGFTGAPQ